MEDIKLLTPEEAARLLMVKKDTIYVWARKGKIPCYRLGKRVRFDKNDLIRFIKRSYHPIRDYGN